MNCINTVIIIIPFVLNIYYDVLAAICVYESDINSELNMILIMLIIFMTTMKILIMLIISTMTMKILKMLIHYDIEDPDNTDYFHDDNKDLDNADYF